MMNQTAYTKNQKHTQFPETFRSENKILVEKIILYWMKITLILDSLRATFNLSSTIILFHAKEHLKDKLLLEQQDLKHRLAVGYESATILK